MKLHIHNPNFKSENDHININCLPSLTIQQRIAANCCPNEASQIYLNNSINSWEKDNFFKHMNFIIPLLSKGGVITIKDADLLLLGNAIMREPSARDTCVSIMTKCKWVYDMQSIKSYLGAAGITITNSYYILNEFSFVIIGVKN